MGTDAHWEEEELKQFSEELSKHKTLDLDSTLYTIFMTNSEVLYKMSRALNMDLPAYDMLQMCYSFRDTAIKKMRTYIGDGGSWSEAWGAPHWIRTHEPRLAIIEKALEAEIADGGRPMARVVSELAAAARDYAAGAALPDQALRSGEAISSFARARRLPLDGLASLWCILYSESIRHVRLLWAAGDKTHAVGWPAGASWDVVELALQYDTQLAIITSASFKAKRVVSALTLLFELISSAYSEIEEQVRAKGAASVGRDGEEPRLSRERERALWRRVYAEYTSSGRVVSALALQRRWCGLRRLARDELRPETRRRPPAHPLLLAIALRFPWVLTAEQPTWEQLVRRRRAYRLPAALPVNLEQPYSQEQKQADMFYIRKILKMIMSDPVEQETAAKIDPAPCIEVSDDDDGPGDAARASVSAVTSNTAVHDTHSNDIKQNGVNCVKASIVDGSREKSKNNVLDEEAKTKSCPGLGNIILYVDYEKSVGSMIQDINVPKNFVDSLQNGDVPFVDVSIDRGGGPPNKTNRDAGPEERRAREQASSAVRALIDSVACEPPPTVFNNSQIIVIPSLKITKIIVPDKTNICGRMHEKCNINTTKSEYGAEETEASEYGNNIKKNEDTPAELHDDSLVEIPTKLIDKGRQNINRPQRPEATALDDNLIKEAKVIVRPLENIPMWRKFSRNGVINCRRISIRKLTNTGVGKSCRGALRRYAAGAGCGGMGAESVESGAVRGGTGASHERKRALAAALRLPTLSQSFWEKNIAQLQMLKPAQVILKRLPSHKEDYSAAWNRGVYEPDKSVSVQKNNSKYNGRFKVTSATIDSLADLQRTDDRQIDERLIELRQKPERQQLSVVPGVAADTNKKPVKKRKFIKTSKSTAKQKLRKYNKRRSKTPEQPLQQLTPFEEWERQKNITRLFFEFPPCGGRRPGRVNTEVEAPAADHDAREDGVSDLGRWNNDRSKMPKIMNHEQNKNNLTSGPPAPADDNVIFVDSTGGGPPADLAPVIASVTSLASAMGAGAGAGQGAPRAVSGGGGGPPLYNELLVVKGGLPSAGQKASKPFEIALSLHRSISLVEYMSSGLSLVNPVFRLDAKKPLRMLLEEYIVVTTDPVPVERPTYWTGGGMTPFGCARICFPPETSAQYPELLMCECGGPSKECDLCRSIGRRVTGAESADARGDCGEPGARGQREETGASKIRVKSFAKMAKDEITGDTFPLTIDRDGKTFRKTSSDPLVYENINNFELDPELISCRVINRVLFKRICGNNFAKVLTAVCDAAEVRQLARAGRPLLCSSFRSGESPPPDLFRELQRLMAGYDRPQPH